MSTYNLTDSQKELLYTIVKSDDEGKLFEKGIILLLPGNDQFVLWGCKTTLNSLADLDALCDEGLLSKSNSSSDPKYRIKNLARTAIANDFHKPVDLSEPHLSIGAIIENMSGGNVQAIGNALNSEINQVINDPKLFQPYLEQITEKLLCEVKAELSVNEYAKYQKEVESLKQQLAGKKPVLATAKKIIQTISFLGDMEGSVELMIRVWPLIQPFLTIVALKIANA
ncbi:MAG TPA: hypothetical protein VGK00_11535 [Anaerolineales bacterium]|jgi:hypothetical protein